MPGKPAEIGAASCKDAWNCEWGHREGFRRTAETAVATRASRRM